VGDGSRSLPPGKREMRASASGGVGERAGLGGSARYCGLRASARCERADGASPPTHRAGAPPHQAGRQAGRGRGRGSPPSGRPSAAKAFFRDKRHGLTEKHLIGTDKRFDLDLHSSVDRFLTGLASAS